MIECKGMHIFSFIVPLQLTRSGTDDTQTLPSRVSTSTVDQPIPVVGTQMLIPTGWLQLGETSVLRLAGCVLP